MKRIKQLTMVTVVAGLAGCASVKSKPAPGAPTARPGVGVMEMVENDTRVLGGSNMCWFFVCEREGLTFLTQVTNLQAGLAGCRRLYSGRGGISVTWPITTNAPQAAPESK